MKCAIETETTNKKCSLPRTRPRRRVRAASFEIPPIGKHEVFQTLNYNVSQLKTICKHYGLKRSGNKNELERRVQEHLLFSGKAVVIQRSYRLKLWRTIKDLIGPAASKRNLCINDTDFFTREPLSELPWNQFISLRSGRGDTVYGFDIMSLHQLFHSSKSQALNPYTREDISEHKHRLYKLIRCLSCLGYPAEVEVEVQQPETVEEQQEQWTTSLFQTINELGNYTDPQWFNDLPRPMLIRFVRELKDIWEHRAQLSPQVQRDICPPTGRLFAHSHVYSLAGLPTIEVRRLALHAIRSLVETAATQEWRSLGAVYVLCALTAVSQPARDALPWLYAAIAEPGDQV